MRGVERARLHLRAVGEKRFGGDIAWAERYARAVLATLKRDNVRVDIENNTVA